jgi:hypothetical protein
MVMDSSISHQTGRPPDATTTIAVAMNVNPGMLVD